MKRTTKEMPSVRRLLSREIIPRFGSGRLNARSGATFGALWSGCAQSEDRISLSSLYARGRPRLFHFWSLTKAATLERFSKTFQSRLQKQKREGYCEERKAEMWKAPVPH